MTLDGPSRISRSTRDGCAARSTSYSSTTAAARAQRLFRAQEQQTFPERPLTAHADLGRGLACRAASRSRRLHRPRPALRRSGILLCSRSAREQPLTQARYIRQQLALHTSERRERSRPDPGLPPNGCRAHLVPFHDRFLRDGSPRSAAAPAPWPRAALRVDPLVLTPHILRSAPRRFAPSTQAGCVGSHSSRRACSSGGGTRSHLHLDRLHDTAATLFGSSACERSPRWTTRTHGARGLTGQNSQW